ncbi:MAG TPA: 5-(carboxyamino)imidazole ribonucleotide synthase [Gammaproteobacteria bacterium]|nr:5-(carboxyamino)imidazole ribonucleotide synthase [Gammaproteobacteria bacterium]
MKVGILGGGQLAQMLVLAGIPLGYRFVALDPDPNAPAGRVAPLIKAEYDDPDALDQLADQVDVVTYDFENVPAHVARRLAGHVEVHPPGNALAAAQDRLPEKRLFGTLGIDTAAYRPVDSREELEGAVARLGLPALLKTRRLGYDGKGQFLLRRRRDIDRAWEHLRGRPAILEGFVEFEREVSLLCVRSTRDEVAFYPLVENRHRGGILRVSRAPYRAPVLQRQAEAHGGALLAELDYVGVLAIEFFLRDGVLIANEMAPRVHNSGHWTIEGAQTSQFENHLRAVTGLPLGDAASAGASAMVNCIGGEPALADVAAIAGAHVHSYGKSPRRGRKLGHITLAASDPETLERRLPALLELIEDSADAPGDRTG